MTSVQSYRDAIKAILGIDKVSAKSIQEINFLGIESLGTLNLRTKSDLSRLYHHLLSQLPTLFYVAYSPINGNNGGDDGIAEYETPGWDSSYLWGVPYSLTQWPPRFYPVTWEVWLMETDPIESDTLMDELWYDTAFLRDDDPMESDFQKSLTGFSILTEDVMSPLERFKNLGSRMLGLCERLALRHPLALILRKVD